MKYLNKSPSLLVGIRDVKWVDDDSYAVVFEVCLGCGDLLEC